MYFWHFGSQYIWLCCKLKVADWWIIDLMFLSHHHLSVSIRVCETVCLHVCVPAHSIKFSCWQCNSSRLIGVWTLSCLPTMTPTACLVWQSACLPKRACASPLISSPFGSASWGWSHIDTQHICFCSFLHLSNCSVLLQKKKKLINQNCILFEKT